MYERFTDRARKVFALANAEACQLSHERLGPDHIFLGLLKEGCGVGATVLKNLNVNLQECKETVLSQLKPNDHLVVLGKVLHAPDTNKLIEHMFSVAREMKDNYIGTEHILLGLLTLQPILPYAKKEGYPYQITLENYGVTFDKAKQEIIKLLSVDDRANDILATTMLASYPNDVLIAELTRRLNKVVSP